MTGFRLASKLRREIEYYRILNLGSEFATGYLVSLDDDDDEAKTLARTENATWCTCLSLGFSLVKVE